MRLTIAYSKIKKRNPVLINNDTHQRETVSERPIRPPLRAKGSSKTDTQGPNEHNFPIILYVILNRPMAKHEGLAVSVWTSGRHLRNPWCKVKIIKHIKLADLDYADDIALFEEMDVEISKTT